MNSKIMENMFYDKHYTSGNCAVLKKHTNIFTVYKYMIKEATDLVKPGVMKIQKTRQSHLFL